MSKQAGKLGSWLKEALLLASLPAIGLAVLYCLSLLFWAALIAGASLGHYKGFLIQPVAYTLLPERLWQWAKFAPLADIPHRLLPVGDSWPHGALGFMHAGAASAIAASWPYALGLAALALWLGYRHQARWVDIAAEIERRQEPPVHLAFILRDLCRQAGITPPPHLTVWKNAAPNAFASGLGPASYQITLTSSLLTRLTTIELRAVLAHELGHIARGDVRLATLCHLYGGLYGRMAGTLWRLIGDSAGGADTQYNRLFFSIPFLIPVACLLSCAAGLANLVRLILLRGREHGADAFAATLMPGRDLAQALSKIEAASAPPPRQRHLRESVIYYRKRPGVIARLLSTHPQLDARLARLK